MQVHSYRNLVPQKVELLHNPVNLAALSASPTPLRVVAVVGAGVALVDVRALPVASLFREEGQGQGETDFLLPLCRAIEVGPSHKSAAFHGLILSDPSSLLVSAGAPNPNHAAVRVALPLHTLE